MNVHGATIEPLQQVHRRIFLSTPHHTDTRARTPRGYCALTPTEFRVLLCLVEHAGAMRSYAQLVRCAQGFEVYEVTGSELIKPHIHHLRQKMEPDPSAPCYILNVRNKGYCWSQPGSSTAKSTGQAAACACLMARSQWRGRSGTCSGALHAYTKGRGGW
jgi:DNA-binding winged helix-turn-helix (wHTH) protein